MLTQEDKQLIAEYMGWTLNETSGQYEGYDGRYYSMKDFDLNDAGLCVEKMVEKDDFWAFFKVVSILRDDDKYLHAWLFNAENFFAAMAQWLKERGK